MNAKSLEEIKKMKGKTDWERVKKMTDGEIEQNARAVRILRSAP